MDQIAATDVRSANHGEVAAAQEEFQKLLIAAPGNGNSFTAVLELPENQAMNLLTDHTDVVERHRIDHSSNRALIERAAKHSIFADEEAGVEVQPEPLDCGNPNSFDLTAGSGSEREKPLKRKERDNKCKGESKKSKTTTLEEGEKLPYVHVRARRGQATDSHSLAERVRREKINARMKLLQELVPGCNKISGTALVLDEIINHVQYLQRQVEHLSMRLATVNPRIDFNLNSLISGNQSMMGCSYPNMAMALPIMCPEIPLNGNRQQFQQQWHAKSLTQPVWVKEENNHNLGALDNLLMTYGSSAHSASLHSSQLKMEL